MEKSKTLFWLQMNVELNWLRIVVELLVLLISVGYLYWAFWVVGPCIGFKGLHPLVLTLWGGFNIGAFVLMIRSCFELIIVALHVVKIYFRCRPH